MNRFIVSFLLTFLSLQSCSAQGGAEWTAEEAAIIKQKILRLALKSNRVIDDYYDLYPDYQISHARVAPNFAKVLRLGFHDCLTYQDPVGPGQANGCDGCLNSFMMNMDLQEEFGGEGAPNLLLTNNNGLLATADFLEEIFTNPNFPSKTPSLPVSMKASGKSRADLWAFAALVAAEVGIENNNLGCKGTPRGNCGNLQDDFADCEINMPREFQFKTGRIDCTPEPGSIRPFLTTKPEIHPNTHGNGQDTIDFHKANFNLTARETIALMGGAHSVGRFNPENSFNIYRWTRKQERILNNQLIRHYAERPQYFYECVNGEPLKIGDAYGNKSNTSWIVSCRGNFQDGGPCQWFHAFDNRCPATNACINSMANMLGLRNSEAKNADLERAEPPAPASCCQDLEPGLYCKPECVGRRRNGETAMSAETGFYRKFSSDPVTGRPFGCPGLDNAKFQSGQRKTASPVCEKNDYAPEGEPLYMIVEEFADDQQSWINTFVPSMEKMVANGYGENDLVEIQN